MKITSAAYPGGRPSTQETKDVIASPAPSGSQPRAASYLQTLTSQEIHRLTLYKWRYALEAHGFRREEIPDLLFLKWLQATRRVAP